MDSVIVTGATRGIGLAIADRLARDGFQVVAIARRNSEELEASAADFAQKGPGSLVFSPLDLSDITGIPAFVRELRKRFVADIWARQQRGARHGRPTREHA